MTDQMWEDIASLVRAYPTEDHDAIWRRFYYKHPEHRQHAEFFEIGYGIAIFEGLVQKEAKRVEIKLKEIE